jgi:hypothetical protein
MGWDSNWVGRGGSGIICRYLLDFDWGGPWHTAFHLIVVLLTCGISFCAVSELDVQSVLCWTMGEHEGGERTRKHGDVVMYILSRCLHRDTAETTEIGAFILFCLIFSA